MIFLEIEKNRSQILGVLCIKFTYINECSSDQCEQPLNIGQRGRTFSLVFEMLRPWSDSMSKVLGRPSFWVEPDMDPLQ